MDVQEQEREFPAERLDIIYSRLQERPADDRLPELVLKSAFRHMPAWDYRPVNEPGSPLKLIIERETGHRALNESTLPDPPETLEVDASEPPLMIRADVITVGGLKYVLELEKQLSNIEQRSEDLKCHSQGPSKHIIEGHPGLTDPFHKFFPKYPDIDIQDEVALGFSAKEIKVLEAVLHSPTQAAAADKLGISAPVFSRILRPLKEKLGTSSTDEAALASISLGIGDLDSLSEGKTDALDEGNFRTHKSIIDIYNPDPAKSVPLRALSDKAMQARWYRAMKATGINSRRRLVLSAVKDGRLELPDRDKIMERVLPEKPRW